MKKWLIYCFLLCLLPGVLAGIELNKEEYSSLETVNGEILFDEVPFESIKTNQVMLKDDGERVSVPLYLEKINDERYFFSFDLPSLKNGSYSLLVEEVPFERSGQIVYEDLSGSVEVLNEGSGLQVFPGFFVMEIESFELPILPFRVKNVGSGEVSVSFSSESVFLNRSLSSFSLNSGLGKEVKLRILESSEEVLDGNLVLLYAGEEQVLPVFIQKKVSVEENESVVEDVAVVGKGELEFTIFEESISLSLYQENSSDGEISFRNSGDGPLENVEVFFRGAVSDFASSSLEGIDRVNAGQELSLFVSLNKEKNLDKDVEGELVLRSGSEEVSLPIFLSLLKEEAVIVLNESVVEDVPEIIEEESSGFLLWILLLGVFLVGSILIVYLYKRSQTKNKEFDQFMNQVQKRR